MLFDLFESQEIQNNVSENTRYYISLVGYVSGDVSLKEHSGYCQGRIRRGTEGALFYFPSFAGIVSICCSHILFGLLRFVARCPRVNSSYLPTLHKPGMICLWNLAEWMPVWCL